MFCKNCGNFIGEADKFCQSCGAPVTQNTSDTATQTTSQPGSQVSQQTTQKPLGMKWYKFIVYVQLFLSMLVFAGNGIRYFNDDMNGSKEEWEVVYTVFPKLKILNIVFGIIHILYIGFLALIWYRMFNYKKNAPVLYIINYIIQMVLEWIWLVIAITYTGMTNEQYSSMMSSAATKDFMIIIYILLNTVYFKKRKFMFNK